MNLESQSNVDFRGDVFFMAGQRWELDGLTQPTTASSVGLIMPAVNHGVNQYYEKVYVVGFYTAIRIGECTVAGQLIPVGCHYGLEFPAVYHPTLIEWVIDMHCQNGINVVGAHSFRIVLYDTEHEGDTNWMTRVYDVNDPSNLALADITWWVVKENVGWDTTWTVNGASGIKTRRIGTNVTDSTIYIGTDLRLVSISGGGKLQARNTGTNTWADVDQWTNP
jgi:hypothetical protein